MRNDTIVSFSGRAFRETLSELVRGGCAADYPAGGWKRSRRHSWRNTPRDAMLKEGAGWTRPGLVNSLVKPHVFAVCVDVHSLRD